MGAYEVRMFLRVFVCVVSTAVMLLPLDAEAEGPTTILHSGRVFTADYRSLWAQAIAIRGDEVMAVGSNARVMTLAGPRTRLVDLRGRLVVPGFNDAHLHTAPVNLNGPMVNSPDFVPGPGPTLAAMLGYLVQAVHKYPAGTWLYGIIGEAMLNDPNVNRFVLDVVTPNHPVFLIGWAGHGTFLNSRALSAAGIAKDAPDPVGGWYGRVHGTRILDGSLYEYASYRVMRKIADSIRVDAARAHFREYAAGAVQLGITSLQDMTMYSGAHLQEIMADLQLPLRLRNICFLIFPDDKCAPVSRNFANPRITWGGFKWVLDGTPVERNAALTRPYSDMPSTSGALNFSPAFLRDQMRHGLGFLPFYQQRINHAIGDRAIDEYLDALSAAAPARLWRALRPRLEHGDFVTPAQVDRLRDLGVVVVQNPTHFTLTSMFYSRLGAQRVRTIQPLRSLVRSGIPIAIGSDGIGEPTSPFVDLTLAVIHPTRPSEALSMEEAVIAHTYGSAYAEFEEYRKGTLMPGMLADLAVLSQDIFAVPVAMVPATFSIMTMVGGEVVHSTGDLRGL